MEIIPFDSKNNSASSGKELIIFVPLHLQNRDLKYHLKFHIKHCSIQQPKNTLK